MTEWLVERGIGETRAVRIASGEISDSRILLDGVMPAGSVVEARLKQAGTPAVAEGSGTEFLLPKGAPGVTEGAPVTVEITREAIPGNEPWKRPLAKVTDRPPAQAGIEGEPLAFPAPADVLDGSGWSDLLDEARTGMVRFDGGELRISATPAMTLIDVDGSLPPADLAVAGAAASAKAIRRLDIGGSIGIDLPTVAGKAPRLAAAEAVDAILPQPFERTAVNGFGFLQIVRPRRRASLVELAQDRAAFEGRALLRRAAFAGPGPKRLVANPAVIAVLDARPEWIDALARQVGGVVTLRSETSLAIQASYAEKP